MRKGLSEYFVPPFPSSRSDSIFSQSPTLAEPEAKKKEKKIQTKTEFPNCDHGVYQLGLGVITDSTNK